MKKATKSEIGLMQEILYSQVYDFACRIAPIYKLLKWAWGDFSNGHAPLIPTASKIATQLDELIEQLEKGKNATEYSISVGGLVVGFYYNGEEFVPYMKMEIIPED